jgi:hypothetical protein
MKKIFLFSLLFFSLRIFSQVGFPESIASSLDSFNGNYSKVVLKHFTFNDTLPEGKNWIPYDTTIFSYLPSGQKSSVESIDKDYDLCSIEKYTYNKQGHLIEIFYRLNLGQGFDIFYDTTGKEINASYSEPECDGGDDTMSYDSQGKLVAVYEYGQVCPEGSVEHYHYDKNGNMYLMETSTRNGKADGDFFHKDSICKTYDEKGRIISENSFSIEYSEPKRKKYTKRKLEVVYEKKYTYSEDGKTTIESNRTPADSKVIVNQYCVSDSGLLMSDLQTIVYEKTSARNEKIDSVLIVYEYDAMGFEKKCTQTEKGKIRIWKNETIYNSDGNPVSSIEYFQDKKVNLFTWEYFK